MVDFELLVVHCINWITLWLIYPFNCDIHFLPEREMGHLQSNAMGQICPHKRCSMFCMPQNIISFFCIYMCILYHIILKFNCDERQCGFKGLTVGDSYNVSSCMPLNERYAFIMVQPAKSQASHFPQEQHQLAWQSPGQCQGRKVHPAVPSSSTRVEQGTLVPWVLKTADFHMVWFQAPAGIARWSNGARAFSLNSRAPNQTML